jgi:HK97 family phage portal protein
MNLKFKRLESLKVPETEQSPPTTVPTMVVKSSRIWGADEEYNYDRASRDMGYVVGLPQPVKSQTYSQYVTQYGNNVWVYAAVYQIAMSLASVPLNLYKKARTKNSRPAIYDKTTDPLVQLFNRPNPFMSQFDLKEAIGAGLELTGNAYLEKVFNKSGKIIKELYPLQPHKMEIIPDSSKKIKGYTYNAGAAAVEFKPNDIAHFQYYNPTSDFYGMGPLSPAEVNVNTNNYAKTWNMNFFKNSALPKGALQTDGILDNAVVKRIKAQWKAAHSSVSKSHEIAILEGGLKWQDIGISRKDLDFDVLLNKDRSEILASFGVYEALLGIVDNINNSSMDNLKKLFWENTMLPKMEKMEADMNFGLVYPYDDSLYLAFDKDSIEALKGSQETRARIAGMLVDRGIFTQNEARTKFFNMPDVEWGDTWYMPLNLIPVDKAGEGMGTGTGAEGDKVPGRQIGRPAVDQTDVRKFLALADLFGLDLKTTKEDTLIEEE